MKDYKRSIISVSIALIVILVGLFLVCAQRRAALETGDDLALDDEQFRLELLDMLDLADDTSESASTTPLAQESANTPLVTSAEELPDQTEVLALLTPEIEEENQPLTASALNSPRLESASTATAANMGLSEEMFIKIRNEVSMLEYRLEKQSSAVDSIKRIIDSKNARIRELEARIAASKQAGRSSGVRAATAATASGRVSSDYVNRYEAARALFEGYQYDNAITQFQQLLSEFPSGTLADNCQYWIGESYFGLKQYQKAIIEFQKVFAYSKTVKHDDAQLMIGLSYVRLNQNDRARTEFESFLNTYGGSEYTGVAQRYYRNI